jgi:hypothetical protein
MNFISEKEVHQLDAQFPFQHLEDAESNTAAFFFRNGIGIYNLTATPYICR